MEPIIKVDNVSMCFNLSKEKHESLKEYFLAMVQGRLQYDEFYALKDVSLDIMPGDFYGLVGLNGSGKSTLLKTIAGVYKPSKGKVTVNGTIAPLIELGAGFDMDLTARENIYLNGTVLGFSPKYLDEKFDEIVEFSELQNFLDVPLKNYSSGMVARIGFAIATAMANCGATIVFNDIKQELVDKGLAAYKEAGIEAHGYVCDVTNEDAVNEMVKKITAEVGHINVLVNNAGIIKRIPMIEMTAAQFRQVIDVDLNAPFIVAKAVIPDMIEQGGGKIINICSMMSLSLIHISEPTRPY